MRHSIFASLIISLPSSLIAGTGTMMGNWGDHSPGWFGGMGWIFMLFFWGLVILGIIALLKWIIAPKAAITNSALDILNERYAKGEIDKQEFENKKQDIN